MNKLALFSDTKVFVVAPAHAATGGPEALHQLAFDVHRIFGLPVFMHYVSHKQGDPVPPAYAHFGVPIAEALEDTAHNILIIPETYTKGFPHIRAMQKAIWWLSVDAYYLWLGKDASLLERARRKANYLIAGRGSQEFVLFDKGLRRGWVHLAQSQYALEHLRKKGVRDVLYLREPIGGAFLDPLPATTKEDIVAYNPKKGQEFTTKLIASSSDIRFVPIQHMTRGQVTELLCRAKVYVDFGNHPGRDRIPREAAMAGCCVITGCRGSAGYTEDVSIPPEYKFKETRYSVSAIRQKITECLRGYEAQSRTFDGYRERIRREPAQYESDIRAAFEVPASA